VARVLSGERIAGEPGDAYELSVEIAHQRPAVARPAAGPVTAALVGTALLLGVMHDDVQAAESLLLAGVEAAADDNRYAYLGAIVPLGGSRLGAGWVNRLWLDWLQYRFDSNGQTIEAHGPGASWMIGYHGGTRLRYGLYAGATYRDTELDPDDPTVENRGRQLGLGGVAELYGQLGPAWNFDVIATLSEDPSGAYWTRFRLLRPLSSGPAQIGLETVAYGDPDYRGAKAGVVIDQIPIATRMSLGIKFGANKIEDRDAGAYVGLDLARVFGGR
jgi:hypothetical protein